MNMTTKIDDFIKRVKSTAEQDLFTPRIFYHISEPMFDEMCELLKEQEKEIENLKEIIKKADYTLEIVKDKLNGLLKKAEGRAGIIDSEKAVNGLEHCKNGDCVGCPYDRIREESLHGKHDKWKLVCNEQLTEDIVAILKEREVRELTMDEWREWKNNPKRNPICELWEHDTSPMWVLNPDTIHEPALLMGKLKLFNGKPSFEQCKKVKWK